MSEQKPESYFLMISVVSDACPRPYQPGWGMLCEVSGSLEPPDSGSWMLQTIKIKNFVGIVDPADPAVQRDVLMSGLPVGDVNILSGSWRHTNLYGAKCGAKNTVVVVCVWFRMLPTVATKTDAASREHTPACAASCYALSDKVILFRQA